MSGWLEFFEMQAKCPICGLQQDITVCEDGDTSGEVSQDISSQDDKCLKCGNILTNDDIIEEDASSYNYDIPDIRL